MRSSAAGFVGVSDEEAVLLPSRMLVRETPDEPLLSLRLEQDRCVALHGPVGVATWCSVYEHRPAPCRRVEPGGRSCLDARQRAGLDRRR